MNIEKFSQTPANKERGIKVFTNPRDLFQDFFNSPQYQNALLDRKKRLAQKWQQTHPKLKFVFTKAQEVESLEVFNRSEEVINLFLKFGQEEVKLNYQAALYPEDAQKLLNTYWELIKTKQQGIEKNDNSGDVFVYENQGKKQFANIKDARAYDYLRTQIHNQIENSLAQNNISPNKELAHLLVYFLTIGQGISTDLSPQDNQKAYIEESNRRYDHN